MRLAHLAQLLLTSRNLKRQLTNFAYSRRGLFRRSGMEDGREKKQSILVLDDNPHDRALFREILERAGHSCSVEGSSGKEALTAVENTSFALTTTFAPSAASTVAIVNLFQL